MFSRAIYPLYTPAPVLYRYNRKGEERDDRPRRFSRNETPLQLSDRIL